MKRVGKPEVVNKPRANEVLTRPRTLPVLGIREWRRGWQPIRGIEGCSRVSVRISKILIMRGLQDNVVN